MSPDKRRLSEHERLTKAIEQLDRNMRDLADFFHPGHYLWYSFLRGIVYGLGILVAIAIVVPFLIGVLRSIEWVPLLGDFLSELVVRIENASRI